MATFTGTDRNNEIEGRSSADLIRGLGGHDELDGNGGNDRIYGGTGNDEIDGGSGNDKLFGEDGNDDLDGGAGNDRMNGGTGRDTLDGGAGNDILTGGIGNDIFQFESRDGRDVIKDFARGQDKIEFDIDDLTFADLTIRNNSAGDAVITWGDPAGSSITLNDVNAASLSRNDFIFDT